MIDALLEGLDGLLGHARVRGGSAALQVAGLAPPPLPAGWSSTATQALGSHHDTLSRAGGVFAAGDDETKDRVDAAGAAVRDGKVQMGAIKDDYKRNRDRLAPASSNPEISARIAELDRQRAADGANTIRSTLGRLPAGGAPAAPASMVGQVMPAAIAPLSTAMPAATAPLQMLQGLQGLTAPATSMLTGITLPHTATHPSAPPSHDTAPLDSQYLGKGPAAIRAAIDKALDIKGITDPQARGNWAAGMTTVASRESNFNVDAQNNTDSNAAKGIPSQGAFQFIEPTFRAYHEPGTSSYLRDPVAQACAFVNYAMGRYGVSADGHDLAAKLQQADPTRPPRGY